MALFSKNSIGIDFSDRSLEIVEVKKSGGGVEVVAYNRLDVPEGVVKKGEVVDVEGAAGLIKDAMKNAKPQAIQPTRVVFGLQELNVYSHFLTMPAGDRKRMEEAVRAEIRDDVPLENTDMMISYATLGRAKEGLHVLAFAGSKTVINKWRQTLAQAGLTDAVFDNELLASYRVAVSSLKKDQAVCLVDIGSSSTYVGIFNSKGMRYSFAVPHGSRTIQKEVAAQTKAKPETVEEKVIATGISKSKKDAKASKAIQKAADRIIRQVSSGIAYYGGTEDAHAVTEVILLGGTSLMKGLEKYIHEQLGISAFVADKKLKDRKDIIYPKGIKGLQFFITAIGLGMRVQHKQWDGSDPLFEPTSKITAAPKEKSGKESGKKVRSMAAPAENGGAQHKERKEAQKPAPAAQQGADRRLMLAVILLAGAVLIIGAYFFNYFYIAQQNGLEQARRSTSFNFSHDIDMSLPVAVDAAEYTPDRVRGRVVQRQIVSASEYVRALGTVPAEIERGLRDGERLWSQPLDQPEDPQAAEYPLLVSWLVYEESGVESLAIRRTSQRLAQEFIIGDIIYQSVEATSSESIYNLTISLEVLTNTPVEEGRQEPESVFEEVPQEPAVSAVTVAEGDAYIVYAEPDNTSQTVTSGIGPAEYVYVSENQDWVEVHIDEEATGWIRKSMTQEFQPPESQTEPQSQVLYRVVVTDTPTGTLNVRSGPGTDFEEIGEVLPGDELEVIDEDPAWRRVLIEDGSAGWVYAVYTEQIES